MVKLGDNVTVMQGRRKRRGTIVAVRPQPVLYKVRVPGYPRARLYTEAEFLSLRPKRSE